MRLFIIPLLIETDEKCSRRLDAGIVRSYGNAKIQDRRVWARAQPWERVIVEKGSLRLTREGDRPNVSGSDTSG
jgi:hypothetical protein